MDWDNFLGETLETSKGPKPTREVLKNKKFVGLYFSAHWCGPCKSFTPMLAAFYEQHKEIEEDDLEIIFLSSDRGQAQFSSYFKTMPWVAVPYDNQRKRSEISSTFGVNGIPTLIILSGANGKVKTFNGRDEVVSSKGDTKKTVLSWSTYEDKEAKPAKQQMVKHLTEVGVWLILFLIIRQFFNFFT